MRLSLRSRSLILLYHRVVRADDEHGLCVAPDTFHEQLEALRRHADLVPLAALDLRSRDVRVAISFDDGYRDNLESAAPILSSTGTPATVFVVAGRVDSDREFWWDRLARLLATATAWPQRLELELGPTRLDCDVRNPPARDRARVALYRRLKRLPVGDIDLALDDLEAALGPDPSVHPAASILSHDGLRQLADTRGIEIGAHSLTHPLLRPLPPTEQRLEITGSRTVLERLLGRPVTSFSYPFGGLDAFDHTTRAIVEEAGFARACSTLPGRVGVRSDRLALPRYFVGEWRAAELIRRLRHWLS